MEQGREYRDPDAPPSRSRAHYDLSRYHRHRDEIMRRAAPWLFTQEAVRRRREAEEDRLWDRFERSLGGARA